jgi:Ca2+/Na+ antiporter
LSRNSQENPEAPGLTPTGHRWYNQNTILIAEIAGRVITTVITGVFLVVPLATLTHQSRNTQIVIASILLLVFSFIVAATLKVSNLETMVISAAYAAVLATFVSNAS